MTRPRSTLVSLSDTPWYHVVCRCVRRAFLCGQDAHSGENYDHRRGWIVDQTLGDRPRFSSQSPKDTLKKSSRPQRQEFSTLILLGFTFGKNDVAE